MFNWKEVNRKHAPYDYLFFFISLLRRTTYNIFAQLNFVAISGGCFEGQGHRPQFLFFVLYVI